MTRMLCVFLIVFGVENEMKQKIYKRVILATIITMSCVNCLTACNTGNGELNASTNSVSEADINQVGNSELSKVFFSIEDYDVTLEEAYIYLIQYLFNNSVKVEDITDEQFKTIVDATIDEIKVETVEYKLANVTEGISVSEQDVQSATNAGNYFYDYFGSEFFNKYGIGKAKVDEMFNKQVYIELLKNKALSDATKDYKEEYEEKYANLPFFTVYYILFPSVKYGPDGNPIKKEDGTLEAYSEEEMKEQLAKANELHEKAVNNVKNGINDGNLEGLAKEYGVENVSGLEHNFKGAYNEELNSLIEGMEDGDISEVVKTDAGYMIVRMDNKDDTEFKNYSIGYMAQQSAETFYPKLQESWLSASGAQNIKVDGTMIDKELVKKICQEMNDRGLSITGGEQ